jgi:hypothetical protein
LSAIREGLPLATLDKGLHCAGNKAGVLIYRECMSGKASLVRKHAPSLPVPALGKKAQQIVIEKS